MKTDKLLKEGIQSVQKSEGPWERCFQVALFGGGVYLALQPVSLIARLLIPAATVLGIAAVATMSKEDMTWSSFLDELGWESSESGAPEREVPTLSDSMLQRTARLEAQYEVATLVRTAAKAESE